MLQRRAILTGLAALITAPAIVKVSSLMPVKASLQPEPVLALQQRLWFQEYQAKHTMLSLQEITRESIKLFCNSNAFLKQIDRQYEAEFAPSGLKVGEMLRIRLPNDYMAEARQEIEFFKGEQWQVTSVVPSLAPPVEAVAGLALAAAVVESAPKILENPVTRRFWSKS